MQINEKIILFLLLTLSVSEIFCNDEHNREEQNREEQNIEEQNIEEQNIEEQNREGKLFNFRQITGDRPCTTPRGQPGRCQDVSNCPALLLDFGTLVRSICFRSLFRPGTCCPIRKDETTATKTAKSTTTTVAPESTTKKQTTKRKSVTKAPVTKKQTGTTTTKTTKSTTTTVAPEPTTKKQTTKKKSVTKASVTKKQTGFEKKTTKVATTTRPATSTRTTTTTQKTVRTTRRTTRRTTLSTRRPFSKKPIAQSATTNNDVGLKNPPVYPDKEKAPARIRYACGRQKVSEGRIVNGTKSYPGQWPWMAALYLNGIVGQEFHCGGTVISRQYIITAAHCTIDKRGNRYNPSQFSIILGDHDLASSNNRLDKYVKHVKVQRIRVHNEFKNFDHRYFQNDIALLKLSKPIDFSPFVLPVCLPSKAMGSANLDSLSGEFATVIGYGRTSYSGPQSKTLMKAQMPIWWNKACDDAYFPPIYDTNVCAGYVEGGIDSCQGDSGGPLLLYRHGKWILLGIVSFGQNCAEPGIPGVYTRVPKFINWVLENVNK